MTISNRYNLIKQLGEGGFGEVWLAEDTTTGKRVALKLYRITGKGHEELVREFNLVDGLNSDNLIRATHVERDGKEGLSYLVMEYCRHGSLEQLIGKVDEQEVWRILRDVSAGLVALSGHTIYDEILDKDRPAPVVHQDLKPANILISKHDKDGHNVYAIADFGISKMSVSKKSGSNNFSTAGTLAYMGPERFSPKYKPIVESDIWSLGAMLYELVEGRPPFPDIEGLSGGNWLNQAGTELPKIENGSISNRLCSVIYSCLSKDVQKRPTAGELLECADKELTLSQSNNNTNNNNNNSTSDRTEEIDYSTIPKVPRRNPIIKIDWEYWKSFVRRYLTKKTPILIGGIVVFIIILIGALYRPNSITKKIDCFPALSERIDSINPSEVGVLSDNVYFYRKDNKVFFIDSTGENIANGAAFDTFNIESNVIVTGLFNEREKKEIRYGIISLNGKELLACENVEIRHPADGVHTFKKDTLWGWVNDSSVVKANSFRGVGFAGIDNLLLCITNDGYQEFWDCNGTRKLPSDGDIRYYEASTFTNGYAWVKTTQKSAPFFIDKNGVEVWSPVDAGYSNCEKFIDNKARVSKYIDGKTKYGLIDNNFHEVLPCQYDVISGTSENAIVVETYGKRQLFFCDKKTFRKLNSDDYPVIAGSLILFGEHPAYTLYSNGECILKNFQEFYNYSDINFVEVKKDGFYRIINKKNGKCSQPYDYITILEKGKLFRVVKNELYGLIDTNFNTLVDNIYTSMGYYKEGLIRVKVDSYYGFIDQNGDMKILNEYIEASDFEDGFAIVKFKGKYGLINTNGSFVILNEYDNIEQRGDGLFAVCKNGKYGVFDVKKNAMVVPCEYSNDFKYITHNRFPIFDGERWGIYTSDGRSTLNYRNNSNSTVPTEL